jgi:hypothetical protein
MLGATVCRSHGGRGVIRKGFIPGLLTLTDEEILTLEEMMAEDDMTLKREFHLLRLFFGKAIAQFQQVSLDTESNSVGDVIGEMRRLAAIVDRLSSISERRVRVMESAPKGEPEVRVRFDDPRVQYLLKEKLREMHHYTIRLVLAVVIQYADPTGALGLAGKLPKSFVPFLPSSSEAKQLEASNPEEGLGALENTDMVL